VQLLATLKGVCKVREPVSLFAHSSVSRPRAPSFGTLM
jgi:hypothetical protein